MMKSYPMLTSPGRQRGVATLLISLILLVVITFVTLYTSRSVLMEQKIATNEYRGRMAFEAAEAGLESTLYAISQGWTRDNDTLLIANNWVFDSDGDGAPDTNRKTLGNGSSVSVVLTEASENPTTPTEGDFIATQVQATGVSDDGTAQRVITQVVALVNPLPNMPESPLLTRGAVTIGGSVDITNPEGHSTIWSGADVDIGSNNATQTAVADPSDPNYPGCLGGSGSDACGTIPSSSNEIIGIDVIEQDTSLSNLSDDEFFQNFFGASPTNYRDSRVTYDGPGDDYADFPALDGVTGEVIWHQGDVALSAGNTTIGTADEPVILIIDGNLSLAGTVEVNGLVFVTGSTNGTGTVDVTGSMVVQGNNSTSGGSLEITYNSSVLSRAFDVGSPTSGAGSWRDF